MYYGKAEVVVDRRKRTLFFSSQIVDHSSRYYNCMWVLRVCVLRSQKTYFSSRGGEWDSFKRIEQAAGCGGSLSYVQ
jgi:hypothetical protein